MQITWSHPSHASSESANKCWKVEDWKASSHCSSAWCDLRSCPQSLPSRKKRLAGIDWDISLLRVLLVGCVDNLLEARVIYLRFVAQVNWNSANYRKPTNSFLSTADQDQKDPKGMAIWFDIIRILWQLFPLRSLTVIPCHPKWPPVEGTSKQWLPWWVHPHSQRRCSKSWHWLVLQRLKGCLFFHLRSRFLSYPWPPMPFTV